MSTSAPPAAKLTAADVLQALWLVAEGRIYDLDCGRFAGMPVFPGNGCPASGLMI